MFPYNVEFMLRAMAYMAAMSPKVCTIKQIALAVNGQEQHLEELLRPFRRIGLIHAQRGVYGGVWLAKPASEISLLQIVAVADAGNSQPMFAKVKRPANLVKLDKLLHEMTTDVQKRLSEVLLADVVAHKRSVVPRRRPAVEKSTDAVAPAP